MTAAATAIGTALAYFTEGVWLAVSVYLTLKVPQNKR